MLPPRDATVPSLEQKRDWNDENQQASIPAYRVEQDRFASGYIAGLQRQKRLKKYLHMVYQQPASNVQVQPGHIRPSKHQRQGGSNHPTSSH